MNNIFFIQGGPLNPKYTHLQIQTVLQIRKGINYKLSVIFTKIYTDDVSNAFAL